MKKVEPPDHASGSAAGEHEEAVGKEEVAAATEEAVAEISLSLCFSIVFLLLMFSLS